MSGTDTASMVPVPYDLIVNGYGYKFLDTIDSNIPFRVHKAVYGFTPPFVERQNVSNNYGDNAQDFFQTIRQRDWSLGEQQKYFRAGQDGRYWQGSNIDISTPGQVTLAAQSPSLAFSATVAAGSRETGGGNLSSIAVASSTKLFRVNLVGTITDLGVHGLGATPSRFGICCDGVYNFITTTAVGTVGVRLWDGAAFSTFSATGADAVAYLNNSLYGLDRTNQKLIRWDTVGTATTLFSWKTATGATNVGQLFLGKLEAYGGKLLILLQYGPDVGAELWIYDGTGTSRLAVFPSNFVAYDLDLVYGVAFISGSYGKPASSTTWYTKPAVLFFDGSTIGKLWEANAYNTSAVSQSSFTVGPHPALGVLDGRLIFTDDTTATLLAYSPATGGVSTIASYSAGGDSAQLVTAAAHVVHTRNSTTGYYLPSTTYQTSGYIISSLIDFDSSLSKVFRGATVEFDAAADGNGGSVDIAYQLNGLSGAFTSLITGATSGTEVLFPANVAGHSVTLKVTINKGTSTAGPTLKSLSVRGAPVMPTYPRGEYILDCTGTPKNATWLRDDSFHRLTGYEQVQNLLAAARSQTPISITDKVNGTFTGFVDLDDAQGFDVYEIHAAPDDPLRPGSYVVRLTARGV